MFDKNSKGQQELAARLPVPSVCSRLVEGGKLKAGKAGMMLKEAVSTTKIHLLPKAKTLETSKDCAKLQYMRSKQIKDNKVTNDVSIK